METQKVQISKNSRWENKNFTVLQPYTDILQYVKDILLYTGEYLLFLKSDGKNINFVYLI